MHQADVRGAEKSPPNGETTLDPFLQAGLTIKPSVGLLI